MVSQTYTMRVLRRRLGYLPVAALEMPVSHTPPSSFPGEAGRSKPCPCSRKGRTVANRAFTKGAEATCTCGGTERPRESLDSGLGVELEACAKAAGDD